MSTESTASQQDSLERLRLVRDRLLRDGTTTARVDGSAHDVFPIGISAAEGEALRNWVTREKVARTIEIGLAYGVSALFICEGLLMNGRADAQHVVVDPYQSTGFKDCGLHLLDDAGVGHLVEFHCEESQLLLPKLLNEDRKFELAFIDGSHFFEAVFLDLMYVGRMVQPGGIIFVDDYQLPAIARAVSFCLKNLGWTLEEESAADEYHQWAVLRTPRTPVQRTFRDYVEF